MTDGIVLVPSADNMDTDTFERHMNARHHDSLGGLSQLTLPTAYLAACYKSFHDRLHRIRFDFNHEHKPYESPRRKNG